MHLILTHEQADFDAIGALLGAHLMQERTYPVLPRRLNRNVKAFLTLYGSEFPFVEINDLPVEPIESITLVDTQSLVTLRGMNPKTIVHVIDHHSLRPDLSDQWNITLDQTGACTTMFIEGLREQNDVLNPVHATLLLLGIYEDTGSMIFASTTARDARAVSYLLEKGASLQVASRYLNPGLSIEQRIVYDRLLLAAEDFSIKGQHIIVATDNAPEMTDEISSIAHKLRDLLDPSALFLLIQTGEGIRLVARSTTSQVDVSGVAAHFGGGGHDRASAALVKLPASGLLPYQDEAESPFSAARRELIRILPDHIRSSTSVRQIMSRHPLLLAPDTPADKALNLMQRYGYEGYPIVKDGKIIGLLNRRAVDRAVAHHLNLPVASLMEVGDVVVHPDDTIERLRDVMINSGWGQVPVVDPESGEITGIVTRTDLLKHLTGHVPLPGRHNMAKKLETALQPARLALLKTVAAEARLMHLAVYIVGGFVRDLLLDRPSLDFDLVVEGDAIALARALEKKYGGRILAHSRFGTSKWNIAPVKVQLAQTLSESIMLNPAELPENLDLISARQEFYDYPTALPTVERSSIKLDLHRRDFTINTIALRLDGSHYGDLYDYWGGMRDLQANLVRVLHSLSFVDDPTRQLRAVRFEQRFNFKIDERTLELMTESRPLIRNLSGDRLRHELNLILEEERAIAMLQRLNELGLLSAIHPDLPWSDEIARAIETALKEPFEPAWDMPKRVANLPSPIALAYLMWLETLPVEKANRIAERLRLPGSLHTQIGIAIQLQRDLPALIDAPPSLATQQLECIPILALFSVYCLEDMDEYRAPIERYVTTWRHIQPTYTGEDLRLLGIPPGPIYKKILTELRAAWLNGLIKDQTGEQLMFNRLVAEHLAQNRDSNG